MAVSIAIGEYKPVDFTIFEDVLEVKYSGQTIWRESLSGAAANFGVESCDTILNIMSHIEKGEDWSHHVTNHVIASEPTISLDSKPNLP